MSLFQRLRGIIKRSELPIKEQSILTIKPGDVCEVSLITYQVIGRTSNARRRTIMLTLQDGSELKYLQIEDRETVAYSLYSPIDGRLDSIVEVPMTLEMDGRTYHLEEQYNDHIAAIGKTPFTNGGEQAIWQFQSDDRKLMRIEWQEGRFMLYEGEDILPADVEVLRGKPNM
ncbi:DUF4178 domain-containing protein [Paenibacillus sp. GSMTC-2017]|uniref:DUF4178 domain-containing protein n=1 Tax=Paenibacillus sp. GSMTC-2017 TaxID=2794350 RepID=UPI0018D9B88C|nr:DUF4178 domain-containing protein [Paenibacillus sp. GSMTC-2017]MBH5319980.1 DUF4178 domain-containing protein [Paenibacillus sp. GSMTC-2017]